MKVCPKCKTGKAESDFSVGHAYCRACKKDYMSAYWLAHPEERRLSRKVWRKRSRQKSPEKWAAEKKRRRDVDLELSRKKEKIYRDSNPEIHRLAMRRYFQNSPTRRITERIRNRVYQALFGTSKSARTLELLGCSIDELKSWLSGWFQPGMSWENHGDWHIDHRRPCASFNLADPEQQKRCFHYLNLQPLWAKDNLSKGAKFSTI